MLPLCRQTVAQFSPSVRVSANDKLKQAIVERLKLTNQPTCTHESILFHFQILVRRLTYTEINCRRCTVAGRTRIGRRGESLFNRSGKSFNVLFIRSLFWPQLHYFLLLKQVFLYNWHLIKFVFQVSDALLPVLQTPVSEIPPVNMTTVTVSSTVNDDVAAFRSLQYALFITCFVEILGGFFFLLTSFYIVRDKTKVETMVKGTSLKTSTKYLHLLPLVPRRANDHDVCHLEADPTGHVRGHENGGISSSDVAYM